MLPLFIFIFLIEKSHSIYSNRCVKEVPSTEVNLKQSFPIESIHYILTRSFVKPQSSNEFTIGSGVINEQNGYKKAKFIEYLPTISITTDKKMTENLYLVDGEGLVKNALKDRPRYEWTCPAGYYTIPHGSNVQTSSREIDRNQYWKLNTEKVPVNHNYFMNMQLNGDVSIYAAYGSIVVHSVNLNGFTLTLSLKFDFQHVVLGAKSTPSIQITNNYGPGKIIIQSQFFRWDKSISRDVIYGGNEQDVEISLTWQHNNQKHKFVPFDLTTTNNNYAEPQPKLGDFEEENDGGMAQDADAMFEEGPKMTGDSSFVILVIGLVFFVLAIFMVITPFFIPKDNNFELLELYEYYADIDEL